MPKTVYSCDAKFFNTDTESSLYWAGFLAADGCIIDKLIKNKRYFSNLRLALGSGDLAHLEKFKDSLKSSQEIKFIVVKNSKRDPKWNDSESIRFDIHSVELCRSLERFNIIPRKTHIYTFPDWLIEHSDVNHFMRGYFDGDGCIRIDKLGNKRFELRGTESFLTNYRDILVKNCEINNNSINMKNLKFRPNTIFLCKK